MLGPLLQRFEPCARKKGCGKQQLIIKETDLFTINYAYKFVIKTIENTTKV